MDIKEIKEILKNYNQAHILDFFDDLSEDEKASLVNQIKGCDFSALDSLKENNAKNTRGEFAPLDAMELDEISENKDKYRGIGETAIRAGKVCAVLLAGGMGTRLGSDKPKGMYNIGINKDVYIFERLIQNLNDVTVASGKYIPLYIMTSELNDADTREFLKEKNYFGYPEDMVKFFKQDMAPATDYNGRVYMESKGRFASSPNGNAGWYSSMCRAGIDRELFDMGIEWINIFAVDNVLQRICDPVFIGACIDKNVDCGSKVVKKASPDEKVGVMCLEDNKPSIVEYYELTDEMANEKNEKGEPAYNFGVILNYLFKLSAIDNIKRDKLPMHIVEKKIPYMNENGEFIKPDSPNGYKYEQLVLDMIHKLDTCLPFEVVRNKEFAPIKNKEGVDSVESARRLCAENGIEL